MFGFLKSLLFNDDVTGTSSTINDSQSAGSGSLFDNSGPSVNIDGSPMIGNIDIHGHPYGVTDTFSSCTSMFDDSCGMHSGIGCTDDMFSSSSTSLFDDHFGGGIGCSGNLFDD